MRVLGIDGWKGKWVAVILVDGVLDEVLVYESLNELSESEVDVKVIGLDMPLGLTNSPPRKADQLARQVLGPRRSSVFDPPPRFCLASKWSNYQEVNAAAQERCGRGVSAQGFALMNLIREAESTAKSDDRFYEVHPEVSFHLMNGRKPLDFSKKTWNGQCQRRELLVENEIILPNSLPGQLGKIPPDDLLDAAAVAWSANRIAKGEGESFPEGGKSKHQKIWF